MGRGDFCLIALRGERIEADLPQPIPGRQVDQFRLGSLAGCDEPHRSGATSAASCLTSNDSSKPKQKSSGFSLTPQFCSITSLRLPSAPWRARAQIAFCSKAPVIKAMTLERGPTAVNVTESTEY